MFENKSVYELAEQLAGLKLSSRELVEWYLERIKKLDKKINSIIEINPDALQIADELDVERKWGDTRSILHGIPVLIKDNIDTADKMMTAAGSLALQGHHAKTDADIVRNLRMAGAVIIGKTNLSEWANFRGERSISGWSSRGGQTRNPHDLAKTPCGSSSGSAAAMAAGFSPLAIGTETDGSITCPAAINGVVGFKPTLNRISQSGIIPIAHSQDTAGPIAQNVMDAAILASFMQKEYRDLSLGFDKFSLRKKRIGVVRNLMGYNPELDKIINSHLEKMQDFGAEIIDLEIKSATQLSESEIMVLLFEYKQGLNKYLANTEDGLPKSIEELIDYNEKNKKEIMPHFGQEFLIAASQTSDLNDPKYLKAKKQALHLSQEEGIDKALQEHNLDALCAPTTGPAWDIDYENGDTYSGGSAGLAAVAGYPSITVPAGFVDGSPVGMSFFSTANSDEKLLQIAYSFEQLSKARMSPNLE